MATMNSFTIVRRMSLNVTRRAVGAIFVLATGAVQADHESYSPFADRSYPDQVYWGDTHLHTGLSLDANRDGDKNLTPAMAYRFARGEIVTAHNGMQVQLHRPLDFLVVADHAEGLGVMSDLDAAESRLLSTDMGKVLYRKYQKIQETRGLAGDAVRRRVHDELVSAMRGDSDVRDEDYRQSIWRSVTRVADEYNDPGAFSAFIGFEWTSGATHRVVIFQDGADKANQVLPFSTADSHDPEDLWRYLEGYRSKTGGRILAIPHNANTSDGKAFAVVDFDGNSLTKTYAAIRSRWEPLLEVTQIKGDSETHPILSPTDEFSNYERHFLSSNFDLKRAQQSYARSALKLGLDLHYKLGVNPFKFGVIGSTDAHTSLSTADENNFLGMMTLGEPNPTRILEPTHTLSQKAGWIYAASGYAAVWARENTRAALFSAMQRKEVYATTGPRITVRFFGGWDYQPDDAHRPDLAHIGFSGGVPMGGDLTAAPEGKAPRFLIRAVKDPDGANLDRVQVIKGWRSADGELHEKIYNVALSDRRNEKRNGKVQPVGSTVDVANASYTNTIGDAELAVVWEDPDFDAEELAFYYVRVLEIPTPRWTAYDAKFFNIRLEDIPDEVPMVTQERAYTSPIWYTP